MAGQLAALDPALRRLLRPNARSCAADDNDDDDDDDDDDDGDDDGSDDDNDDDDDDIAELTDTDRDVALRAMHRNWFERHHRSTPAMMVGTKNESVLMQELLEDDLVEHLY